MLDLALQDMLNIVRTEKKTGRIVALSRDSHSSQLFTISVEKGEIANANLQNLKDNEALKAILDLNINEIRFLPVTDIVPSQSKDLYSIDDFFRYANTKKNHQNSARHLKTGAIELLSQLIDPNVSQMVETIAKNTPPTQRPKEFLDRCTEYAEMMVGKKKAQAAFAPLYLQVH